MRRLLADKKMRYLVLLPIIVLIILTIVNSIIMQDVDEELFQQHMNDTYKMAKYIQDSTESLESDTAEHYESHFVKLVEVGDKLEYIAMVPYKVDNNPSDEDGVTNIGNRDFAIAALEPMDSAAFREAIASGEKEGHIEYSWNIPNTEQIVEMRIYYRWIKGYMTEENGYLLAAAVGKESMSTKASEKFYILHYVNVGINILMVIWCTVMMVSLGHIYCERKGKDKWRNKEEGK